MTEGFQDSFEEVQHVWRELCWKICFVIQCWKNQWIRLWMWKRLWIKHKNTLKVDLCPPNLQMFWAQPRSTSKYIFTITNNFAVKIIAINYGIMALCFFRPPTVSFRSDQQFPQVVGKVYRLLMEIESRALPMGLHQVGVPPSAEESIATLVNIAQLDRPDAWLGMAGDGWGWWG